jgi:hypothetical protein
VPGFLIPFIHSFIHSFIYCIICNPFPAVHAAARCLPHPADARSTRLLCPEGKGEKRKEKKKKEKLCCNQSPLQNTQLRAACSILSGCSQHKAALPGREREETDNKSIIYAQTNPYFV